MAFIPLSIEKRKGGYVLRDMDEIITALDKTEIDEPVEFTLNAPYEDVNKTLQDKISSIGVKTDLSTLAGELGILGGIALSACVDSNYLLIALGSPILAEYYSNESKKKIKSLKDLSKRLYSVYGK